MSYIQPPKRIRPILRMMLSLVEKRLGKQLLANRILTWYPKALIGSGVMEGLIAHDEPEVPRRLLALIRVYTSFLVSCAFCIDLNSRDFEKKGLSKEEITALQGKVPLDQVATLKEHFSERGIVIIASTCAKVNFWARLIQSLGVPPAGFSAECLIPNLDSYTTMKDEF